MKVLYHHRTLGDGAEGIHIREMVTALRDLGHQVRVVSLIGEGADTTKASERRWTRVSRLIPEAVYEGAELAYNVIGRRQILSAAAEFAPDVIYDRYNSYSTAALTAANVLHVPLMLEMNAPVAYERTEYERLKLRMPNLARRYERRICRGAHHIFVVSSPLKAFVMKQYDVHSDAITVLPNGANPISFDPELVSGKEVRRYLSVGDRPLVGFVGVLRPWHGVELLIEAVAALTRTVPDVRLLIVGDGAIEGALREHADRLGLTHQVIFTGRVPHAEVRSYIAAIDIAVSPRVTFYASPMKVLEYMALGKPVVAPALENIRDIIDPGRTGVLFEAESVDALTAALLQLLRDGELRHRIGHAARESVVRERNWTMNARRVIHQAESLLSTHAASPPPTPESLITRGS